MISWRMLRLVEPVKYKIINNTQVQLYKTMAKLIPTSVYRSQLPPKREKQE